MNIEKVSYMDVVRRSKSFFSLDISVNSTGWVMWHDGVLTKGKRHMATKELGDRRAEFRGFLTEVIEDRQFEFISVEDTIGGVNYNTNRNLIQLNTIVDDLMDFGVLKRSPVVRVGNTEWKHYLRCLSQDDIGIKGSKDKEEIVFILKSLGFESPVQDICDAMGLALGVIARDVLKFVKPAQKKLKEDITVGYTIKQLDGSAKAESYAAKMSAKRGLSIVSITPANKGKNLEEKFKLTVRDVGDDFIFLIESDINKLGTLVITQNLDLSCDTMYLVVSKRTGTKKKE